MTLTVEQTADDAIAVMRDGDDILHLIVVGPVSDEELGWFYDALDLVCQVEETL